MNERFVHLYFLPPYLFQNGAPILITAGALLKDNQKDSVLAQLKLRNLKKEKLIACKVAVKAFDPSGSELKGVDSFSYLDLNMETGKDFGTQTAIPLEDKTTRKIQVSVTQAVFEDGTTWENKNDQEWQPLPVEKRKELKVLFPDEELQKQYSIEVGGNCVYVPEIISPFFYCTCGAINLAENGACYNCKREYSSLAQALNMEILTKNKNLRLQEEKYQRALNLQNKGTKHAQEEAIALFTELGDFRDSAERIVLCQNRILQEKTLEKEMVQKKKRNKMLGIFAGTTATLVIAIALLANKIIIPEIQNRNAYQNAEALFENGQYDEAIDAFTLLGEYKDASDRAEEVRNAKCKMQYTEALELAKNGNYLKAISMFRNLGDYSDAEAQVTSLWERISNRNTISAGSHHSVGLRTDGTVAAAGGQHEQRGQCNMSDWNDIVAVSAGDYQTVGLKADGTVVLVGSSLHGLHDVSEWKDIVAISSGDCYTVGLKVDGTVVATGGDALDRNYVPEWKNIIAVSTAHDHAVCLKEDGTVVAAGGNIFGECDVSDWKDIVAISTAITHTVGLKEDGTVIVAGDNKYGQCDVSEWKDIVAVSAGDYYTIGLKKDGTVIAIGSNKYGQCDVSEWKDIVAISAGSSHTIGLKKDGTVIATGYNLYDQCETSGWKNIKLPKN